MQCSISVTGRGLAESHDSRIRCDLPAYTRFGADDAKAGQGIAAENKGGGEVHDDLRRNMGRVRRLPRYESTAGSADEAHGADGFGDQETARLAGDVHCTGPDVWCRVGAGRAHREGGPGFRDTVVVVDHIIPGQENFPSIDPPTGRLLPFNRKVCRSDRMRRIVDTGGTDPALTNKWSVQGRTFQ